jgi:PAS domain S-box-containing protein/putative nucleotidyltransferase with HDIG domain
MVTNSPLQLHRDLSSEWLRALVDSALDAIVTMDAGGRIIAFNPAAEKIFGYHKDKVVGHSVSDTIIPPSLRASHEKGLARYLTVRKEKIIGQRIEYKAMRANGDVFPAEIEIISVGHTKTPVFMAYIRDISESKEIIQERLQYAQNLKKTLLHTVLAMSKTVEIRDPYTAGHHRRVAHLAAAIAQSLKLSEETVEGIFFGALIHDIGKIAVPAEILTRPGKLHKEDIYYLQTHCLKGYEILKEIDYPWPIAEIALQHHEHLDGSGYPQGLRNGEILLEARIVCVADVVEALTSHRPYRPAIPLQDALLSLSKKAGKWYDPTVTKVCIQLFREGYHISSANLEEIDRLITLSLK